MFSNNPRFLRRFYLLFALCGLSFFVSGCSSRAAATFDVYLAPDGNDKSSGLSAAEAVRTLARAHAILEKEKPGTDVRVLIAPGTYREQKVRWNYVRADREIRFEPRDRAASKPLFDGCAEGEKLSGGGTFFTLVHQSGKPSNLIFDSLRIQNYQTAISLNGNRSRPTAWNGRNVVRNCYFYRIGNVSNPKLKASTAAIRFVNSKENVIENNDFIDIINASSGGLLHALYIAHYSDSNRIDNNRFVNHSGDAIRVRDFSNGNVITRNRYEKAGVGGAFSEWYCDGDTRKDCTKETPECPSWENVFRDNLIGTDFKGNSLKEFVFYQDDSASGCDKPNPRSERLITSGNRRL